MYNKKVRRQTKKIANLLRVMGQTARLRILLAIGDGEACVCHLEAILGYRQAYISQQLMELRKVGIVDARRDGRYIFYRLRDRQLLDLIQMAGGISGVSQEEMAALTVKDPLPRCCCPNCLAEINPQVIFEEEIAS
jgi:ArsR family transcriptional regulator